MSVEPNHTSPLYIHFVAPLRLACVCGDISEFVESCVVFAEGRLVDVWCLCCAGRLCVGQVHRDRGTAVSLVRFHSSLINDRLRAHTHSSAYTHTFTHTHICFPVSVITLCAITDGFVCIFISCASAVCPPALRPVEETPPTPACTKRPSPSTQGVPLAAAPVNPSLLAHAAQRKRSEVTSRLSDAVPYLLLCFGLVDVESLMR